MNSTNKTAINTPVMMAIDNKTLLWWINFQPNSNDNKATITKPTYPLNLSNNTVATTSLGFFVCVAKSMLRTRSPPILEGSKALKNTPPENEIITLFKLR